MPRIEIVRFARAGRCYRPSTTRCRLAIFALSALAWIVGGSTALPATPTQATSSRAAREDALRSIPVDRLDQDDRQRVASTIAATSIYRRLPVQVTECDPDLYLFLVRNPDVVVAIWEVMKVSNVAIERTGPKTFRASDGAGTLCQIKYCYSSHDTQVIYAEGTYDGPLLSRPVKARCVLLLKSGYMQENNGEHYVTSRMDTFIAIENAGVDLLAKTLQPLINHAADFNFSETAAFLGALSQAAETNTAGVVRLSGRLVKVAPEMRQQLGQIALDAGEKARQRRAIHVSASEPISPGIPLRGPAERR